jgi:outer membrane immunogenic protein
VLPAGCVMTRLGPGQAALALGLALAATALAAPARAADLPAGPSYYPPVTMPPAQYNWTGFYVGGHVGAGLLADNYAETGAPPLPIFGSINIGPVGLIGGAQAGVNYEFAHWVIGAEASWTASNITGTGKATTAGGALETFTSAPAWFGAATGHVGYAANDLLFYVKGGGALMDVSYTESAPAPFGNPTTTNQHRSGYTAGAGLEYGLTENLSAKLEYDFYGFGTKTYNFPATPVSIRSDMSAVTFGLNYRFVWGGGWRSALCPTC